MINSKLSVSKIESFSCVDGPGIRTVIFFNNCPLRCKFCHNPEMQQEINKLDINYQKLYKLILNNKPYYKSNGGVTFSGGEPLFFLDYIACGKNYPEKIASIVSGVAEGCLQSECALVGGETAEHPGLMPEDDYDLAGFAVGVVDKKDIIDGSTIKAGDTLIGIASSGVHSNGFSLVRKVFEMTKESLDTYYDELGKTLGEALIEPTRIYVKALKNVKNAGVRIKGCSHITGGGFFENVPRMLPENVRAIIKKESYPVPALFDLIQKNGNIEEHMMYNTFNMGLGMVIAVNSEDVETTMKAIEEAGDKCYVVGNIVEGDKGVDLC